MVTMYIRKASNVDVRNILPESSCLRDRADIKRPAQLSSNSNNSLVNLLLEIDKINDDDNSSLSMPRVCLIMTQL